MKRPALVFIFMAVAAMTVSVCVWLRPVYQSYHHEMLYEEMSDACNRNDYRRVRELLRLGASADGSADVEAANRYDFDEHGFTPHIEQVAACQDLRILKLLIASGARPDLMGDGEPGTALSVAIHERNAGAVQTLLATGANPHYPEEKSWTAVDQARALGYFELIPIIKPYLESPKIVQRCSSLRSSSSRLPPP